MLDGLSAARELCRAFLPRVSRTFALSIAMLPDSLRETVCVAYLLCRIVDTIEDDNALEPAKRARLFDQFEATLKDDRAAASAFDCGTDEASRELCAHAADVFLVFRALPAEYREVCRPSIVTMTRGMREYRLRSDAEGGHLRLRDLEDLERYCYFVAGTVGELLTGLFELIVPTMTASARDEARSHTISFGLGLQLVNIVKDVREDLERGDCFLPTGLLAANGLVAEDLADPRHREPALAVIRAVCERARAHLARAHAYTLLWPSPEVRFFCAVPLALALATLHEVATSNDTLSLDRKPKVTRETVGRILQEAQASIGDEQALSALFERCALRDASSI